MFWIYYRTLNLYYLAEDTTSRKLRRLLRFNGAPYIFEWVFGPRNWEKGLVFNTEYDHVLCQSTYWVGNDVKGW